MWRLKAKMKAAISNRGENQSKKYFSGEMPEESWLRLA